MTEAPYFFDVTFPITNPTARQAIPIRIIATTGNDSFSAGEEISGISVSAGTFDSSPYHKTWSKNVKRYSGSILFLKSCDYFIPVLSRTVSDEMISC